MAKLRQGAARKWAIGIGILALVAAPHERLRESLLFMEELALEAVFEASPDMKEAAIESRLATIERFWALCGDIDYVDAPDEATRTLSLIANTWTQRLKQLDANNNK